MSGTPDAMSDVEVDLGAVSEFRRGVYEIARNPFFPRLYLTGGPITVRESDLIKWLDGMARNHTYSGAPARGSQLSAQHMPHRVFSNGSDEEV